MSAPTRSLLTAAQEAGLPGGEQDYWAVVHIDSAGLTATQKEKVANDQETALLALGEHYRDTQDVGKLLELVATARNVTTGYAKSKAAKIIKALIDDMAAVPGSIDEQIRAINESVDWAVASNRGFLRQGLQIRLLSLLYEKQQYQSALELVGALLRELKKLDDKTMLVEVQLHEARLYHALRNLAKARAALTSARTSANSVYTPTLTQAQLDMMSGVLQAEDGDYKTAFSYFFEAFEGYSSLEDRRAVQSLKYLFLVKIMLNLTDDVDQLVANKTVRRYSGRDVDAMTAMSRANADRSLKEFEVVLRQYDKELGSDPFIRSHFTALYDKLFQENLMKVIEPYSCVEISHLAKLLGLDASQIEGKLSQMILDKVFSGVLDQGKDWLYVYPPPEADETYEMGLETMKHMSSVVDLLYEKAAVIN